MYEQSAHTFPFDGIDGLPGERIDFIVEVLLSSDPQTLDHALGLQYAYRQACLFIVHSSIQLSLV